MRRTISQMISLNDSSLYRVDTDMIEKHLGVSDLQGLKDVSDENKTLGINMLIYGTQLHKLSRRGQKMHQTIFYILEDDERILQWISRKKSIRKQQYKFKKNTKKTFNKLYLYIYFIITNTIQYFQVRSRILLQTVSAIFENIPDTSKNNFKNQSHHIIRIVSSHSSEVVILFQNSQQKIIWLKGFLHFLVSSIEQYLIGCPFQQRNSSYIINNDFSENLDIQDVERMLISKQIKVTSEFIKQKFLKYDKNQLGYIEPEDFDKIYEDLMSKDEVKYIYNTLTNDDRGISSQNLQRFFQNIQKQNISPNDCKQICQNFGDGNHVSYLGFVSMLFSPFNTIIDLQKLNARDNMSYPLTYYYIASSHNTYLLSNQLTGKSSLEAYIFAFKSGCKCVEIDCWDGSNGEPIVTHGYTLTSKIQFKEILKCVMQYGFVLNPYPVILSLEVHCSNEQQKIMALYIREIIGKNLYVIEENFQIFPSPEEMQNKVLVKSIGDISNVLIQNRPRKSGILQEKTKQQPTTKDGKAMMYSVVVQRRQNNLIAKKKSKSLDITNNQEMNQVNKQIKTRKTSFCRNIEKIQIKEEKVQKIKKIPQVNNDLELCLSLFSHTMTFDDSRLIWHITSLSEDKLMSLIKKNENNLINYHKRYFSRIYPKGTRISSSNYDPMPGFMVGSQLIALNWQTNDDHQLLNRTMFNKNAKLGYVLKPSFLLQEFEPTKDSQKTNSFYSWYCLKPRMLLKVEIISAQQLQCEVPHKSIDPFVEIFIRGIPSDQTDSYKRSQIVKGNSYNPIFNLNCQFLIRCPELCFLCVSVSNAKHNNQKLGQNCLQVNCIRLGYRVIPLLDSYHRVINDSYLFVKVSTKLL